MKKIKTIVLLGSMLILFSCGGAKVKFESAKEYNDYIVGVIKDVDDAWSDVIHEKDLNKSLAKADQLTQISQEGINKLENLGAFKKEKLFKKSGIEYVKYINKISKKELKEFLNLIHAESPDQKRIDELLVILDSDREAKFRVLTVSQQLFAAKYGLNLTQS